MDSHNGDYIAVRDPVQGSNFKFVGAASDTLAVVYLWGQRGGWASQKEVVLPWTIIKQSHISLEGNTVAKKSFVFLSSSAALLLTFTMAWGASSGFVTGGGWIESPPGAYNEMDLPLFDGSYYELGYANPPVTWDEAVALAGAATIEPCGSAHLATVTSAEEQAVINFLMSPTTQNGWLGGFQPDDELSLADGWQWITGEPFSYTSWDVGEPNDTPFGTYIPGSEQNLETYQVSGVWNDAPGWEPKYHYIIEYEDCDLPAGRAIFSIVAKEKHGALSGRTKFELKSAGLNFLSTQYDTLAVTGNTAVIMGQGTINGQGGYEFMVWVEDGTPDTFRIEIWWEDGGGKHVVYDNGVQAIGGGNIVVHTGK